MRRRPGQALRIGLAPHGAALVRTGWWGRAYAAPLALRSHDAIDGVVQQLRQLFAEALPAGWPVTVVLADELVRIWQVTPPPAARRLADLEAAAAMRFQALFGMPAAGWTISADWHAGSPFLAAAAPLALLAQLALAAREHRFHLVETVPQFVAAMNQWRKLRRPGAWFALVHAGVLTIAAFEGARLAALRTATVPDGADRDWLDSLVAREALRVGLAIPQRMQVCGPAPASWGSPGRLAFACSLLDGGQAGDDRPDLERLARTGSRA